MNWFKFVDALSGDEKIALREALFVVDAGVLPEEAALVKQSGTGIIDAVRAFRTRTGMTLPDALAVFEKAGLWTRGGRR